MLFDVEKGNNLMLSRLTPVATLPATWNVEPGTPERRLSWGSVKKMRAMEMDEKQKNLYQICLLLFNHNVDLKNNKANYGKFVSIRL